MEETYRKIINLSLQHSRNTFTDIEQYNTTIFQTRVNFFMLFDLIKNGFNANYSYVHILVDIKKLYQICNQ